MSLLGKRKRDDDNTFNPSEMDGSSDGLDVGDRVKEYDIVGAGTSIHSTSGLPRLAPNQLEAVCTVSAWS